MKTIFKFIPLLSFTALVLAPLARADEPPASPPPAPSTGDQPHQGGANRAAHRLQMLDEKLHLTDAQKQQITAIWSSSEQQGKALRDDSTLSKEDRRAKMGDIMKASHEQVRAVLTQDQQAIFDAMPPEKHGHRGPPPADGAAPADAPPPKQ
jgi:protein CpxP